MCVTTATSIFPSKKSVKICVNPWEIKKHTIRVKPQHTKTCLYVFVV